MCYDPKVHFFIGKKLKQDTRVNWKFPIKYSLQLFKEFYEKKMLRILRPHNFRHKNERNEIIGSFLQETHVHGGQHLLANYRFIIQICALSTY